MSLWTFCGNVATATAAKFTEIEDFLAFGGKFDLAEVMRRSYRSPAIFVTCEATKTLDKTESTVTASMVMILVVKSSSAKERSPAIMEIASKIATWLPSADFGDGQVVGDPENVDTKNLYGAKADKQGVTLWGFRWEQGLKLTHTADPVLPEATIYADWDLAPPDGVNIEKTDIVELNP